MHPFGSFVGFGLFLALALANSGRGSFLQVEAKPSRGGPSPQRPAPRPPSTPSFPSPSVPTFPSSPSFPTVPAFPSNPSFPTSPSVPTNPSTPTYPAAPTVIFVPSMPTYNRQNYRPVRYNGQDCVEQVVNVTDPLTNETETTTQTVCVTKSSEDSSNGGVAGGAIVGIVLGVLFVGAILACIFVVRQKNSDEETAGDDSPIVAADDEPELWTKVRQQVRDDATGTIGNEFAMVKPINGSFTATYEDEGRTFQNRVDLQFIEAEVGWEVKGSGHDADGGFIVLEGLMSPTGVVYWIEQCPGVKALTQGRFSADGSEMQGTWETAKGVSGYYQNFQLVSASETEDSDEEPEIAVPLGGGEAEIPVKAYPE
uniref:Uncharacterized protein n=1 Tax=Amphora coffeiformis TaxID=265554 RepID=A0A7S3L698_9STRA